MVVLLEKYIAVKRNFRYLKIFINGLIRSYKEKIATGTQMVMEVKKNKLNNSSKWFAFGQEIRP